MITYTTLDTDLTPLELYELVRSAYEFTFLLESMKGPEKFATQSVIGFEPIKRIQIRDEKLMIEKEIIASGFTAIQQYLEDLINEYQVLTDRSTQFVGGLVGFTSYDMIRYIESLPDHGKERQYPDAVYGFYLDGIRYDHLQGKVEYFYHDRFDNRLAKIEELLNQQVSSSDQPGTSETDTGPIEQNTINHIFQKDDFIEAVEKIKEGIIAGETFQTVLSQRIEFQVDGNHFPIYGKLREINPSPYMYFLEFGEYTIIGSSPELQVSTEQEVVTTYPIAGTRRLAPSAEENKQLEDDLLADEKERAEHNMLVDLARNDIGMISAFDTVEVTEYMQIEYFSHVMHLVSKVQGRLKPGYTMFDAFYSTFPAGTVSGAPKIRSMQLIEELEPIRRGPYAGTVGYFGLNQEMVQAITIRTIFGRNQNFAMQAGAGIVLDSDPNREYEETLHKLAALLEVIQNL